MNHYHLYEEIGKGKNTTVYKGRKKKTIEYVAIKSVDKRMREKLMAEVDVMCHLTHGNIVDFYEWYETKNHLWLIYEYCTGGDLEKLLKDDGRLPEDACRKFAVDVINGLMYIHSQGYVYGNLRAANVLFDQDGMMKLRNFFCSVNLNNPEEKFQNISEFAQWSCCDAPEMLASGHLSYVADVWALGCLLYRMAFGELPYTAKSKSELKNTILSGSLTLPELNTSPELVSLLSRLLTKNPRNRPSWNEICCHPFWKGKEEGFKIVKLNEDPMFGAMCEKLDHRFEIVKDVVYKDDKKRSKGERKI